MSSTSLTVKHKSDIESSPKLSSFHSLPDNLKFCSSRLMTSYRSSGIGCTSMIGKDWQFLDYQFKCTHSLANRRIFKLSTSSSSRFFFRYLHNFTALSAWSKIVFWTNASFCRYFTWLFESCSVTLVFFADSTVDIIFVP